MKKLMWSIAIVMVLLFSYLQRGCQKEVEPDENVEIVPTVVIREEEVLVHVGNSYDPLSNVFVRELGCETEISGFSGTDETGEYEIKVTVTSSTGNVSEKDFLLKVADTSVAVREPTVSLKVNEEFDLWSNVVARDLEGNIDESNSETVSYDKAGKYQAELSYDDKLINYEIIVIGDRPADISPSKPYVKPGSDSQKKDEKPDENKQQEETGNMDTEEKETETVEEKEPEKNDDKDTEKEKCTPVDVWVVDQKSYTETIHHEKLSHFEKTYEEVIVWIFNFSDGYSTEKSGWTSQQAYQFSEEYSDEHDCSCQYRYERRTIETGEREVIDAEEYDEIIEHPETGHYEKQGC